MNKRKNHIMGTHNGLFHSDEVLAMAMYRCYCIPKWDTIDIIRTRGIDALAKSDILVDVGGVYSASDLKFDHHQIDGGVKSSAGLVLDYILGKGVKVSPLLVELAHIIDEHDCGVKSHSDHSFVRMVQGLNAPDIFSEVQDKNFNVAYTFAKNVIWQIESPAWSSDLSGVIVEVITSQNVGLLEGDIQPSAWLKSFRKNEEATIALDEERSKLANSLVVTMASETIKAVIVPKDSIFLPTSYLVSKADILIQWDSGQSSWTVQMIPIKVGEFGTGYTLVPSGDSGEVFCHKAGFIGKYRKEENNKISFKLRDIGNITLYVGEK